MTLKVSYINKNKNNEESQWLLFIKEISMKDVAVIVTDAIDDNQFHVAIYGFDYSFYFTSDGTSIIDQTRREILKRPEFLRRILKVGVFSHY